jgi:predicted membrane-bound dolichyl-phosphate-mannose-protein mannosyltransferase
MRNNSILYSIHAIARLYLFCWFFIQLKQPFFVRVKKIIPLLFFLFVIIDFCIVRSIKSFYYDFSSELHATEAALLLIYCLLYFIYLSLREEAILPKERATNWIVAGLTIYVAFNFFIFLFFSVVEKLISGPMADTFWNIHNASYVIFCCFIAKAFYEQRRK